MTFKVINSRNKFGSRKKKDKPIVDGHVFDSNAEASRYRELSLLERKGIISKLEVHPKFVIAKGMKNDHGQHIRQWSYVADFKYFDKENNRVCVEDVKSIRIDKNGKKHGTSQSRDYKLTRNQFMRLNPDILFIESY